MDRNEKHSDRIFWIMQIIFGFVIGKSFHELAPSFMYPFESVLLTLLLATISVYLSVIWGWVDFSYALIEWPYKFRENGWEKFRFLIDVTTLLLYSYLVVYIGRIKLDPIGYIPEFFLSLFIISCSYLISALLSMKQYGKRAAKWGLIIVFMVLYYALFESYRRLYGLELIPYFNDLFLATSIVLTLLYRIILANMTTRKRIVSIDVDGVLADQITEVLNLIHYQNGIELKYSQINNLAFEIPEIETDIGKELTRLQEQRSYFVNMPLHSEAKKYIDRIIKKNRVVISSSREAKTDVWTKRWLIANRIPYDEYCNLQLRSKQDGIVEYDVLIDDDLQIIETFLENTDSIAILFKQPWNDFDYLDLGNYIKSKRLFIAESWRGVFLILKKLKRFKKA